jgi:pimeloyl-ACP methyl ester carboxylesterase
MDGTGELFADFIASIPDRFETTAVRYPGDRSLGYSELSSFVELAAPGTEPFVLVAESFSTPLAIQYAASNPPSLRALVICAGFASSPVKGWRRWIVSLLAPVLFAFPLPKFAARYWLVGQNPSRSLLASIQRAVSSVKRQALVARLRSILACDVRRELDQIGVPILYVQAAQDRLVDAVCFEDIRNAKPQTVLTRIAAPHLVLQREPQKAAEAILRFIQDLE